MTYYYAYDYPGTECNDIPCGEFSAYDAVYYKLLPDFRDKGICLNGIGTTSSP